MEYNTQKGKLHLPEYGRNVQNMIAHCLKIQDREERNKCARAIVDVMGQLNPHLRDYNDFKHKLWDHLFIISDFKLDVDSPYPIPDKEKLFTKPQRLPYPQGPIRYKHYGRSVESFIRKCLRTDDPQQKEEFTMAIANLMKKNFLNWNRDSVNDEVVLDHLVELSRGELRVKENTNLRATHEILAKGQRTNNPNQNPHEKHSGHNNNFKKKKFRKHH